MHLGNQLNFWFAVLKKTPCRIIDSTGHCTSVSLSISISALIVREIIPLSGLLRPLEAMELPLLFEPGVTCVAQGLIQRNRYSIGEIQ